MRLKNNPKAKEYVANSIYCIKDPVSYKGQWNKSFFNNLSLFLEIGSGKGQFLSQLSMENPSNLYLGIEQYESVLFSALKKLEISPVNNLKYLCTRAEDLEDYFAPNEVNGIFLNFSDPWPKKRHAKRRLSSKNFLKIYHNILALDSVIEMKTDNKDLFDFSLDSFHNSPYFDILDYTEDLYSSPLLKKNIPTEYEVKFRSKGLLISKIVAVRRQ